MSASVTVEQCRANCDRYTEELGFTITTVIVYAIKVTPDYDVIINN